MDFALVVSVDFDCNDNDIVDSEEISIGNSPDCAEDGIPDNCSVCVADCECPDPYNDVCTCGKCISDDCSMASRDYGDVDCNGAINIFDVFCVLNGFLGQFGVCSFADCDIQGPGLNPEDPPCIPNGKIDLFDLFAVLDAFGGTDPCGSTRGSSSGGGGGGRDSSGTISLRLAVSPFAGPPGSQFKVHVLGSDFLDLRGYEVAVDVSGGQSGTLTLEAIYVDEARADFVFYGLGPLTNFDMANERMLCALSSGGVGSVAEVYLATFVFRASQDASGRFTVSARPNGGTLAGDSSGQPMEVVVTSNATVRILDW